MKYCPCSIWEANCFSVQILLRSSVVPYHPQEASSTHLHVWGPSKWQKATGRYFPLQLHSGSPRSWHTHSAVKTHYTLWCALSQNCYIFHTCLSAATAQTPMPGSRDACLFLKALSDAMGAWEAGLAGAPSTTHQGLLCCSGCLQMWLEGVRSTQHLGGLALPLLRPVV